MQQILDQIKSGSAFTNPLASLSSAADKLSTYDVASLTAIANSQDIVPNAVDIQNLVNKITLAKDNLSLMVGHSNKISGVDLTGTGNLATIAKTMAAARTANGSNSCQTVIDAFGSIADAASIVNEVAEVMKLVDMIENNFSQAMSSLPSSLETIANRLAQQMIADKAALANAQLELAQHAIATTISGIMKDECAAAVMSGVMTQTMKNAINAERDNLLKKRVTL